MIHGDFATISAMLYARFEPVGLLAIDVHFAQLASEEQHAGRVSQSLFVAAVLSLPI
jgi:hypothetical protein